MTIPAASSSIRRVVSVGSASFLSQTDNNCFGAVMKVRVIPIALADIQVHEQMGH